LNKGLVAIAAKPLLQKKRWEQDQIYPPTIWSASPKDYC